MCTVLKGTETIATHSWQYLEHFESFETGYQIKIEKKLKLGHPNSLNPFELASVRKCPRKYPVSPEYIKWDKFMFFRSKMNV